MKNVHVVLHTHWDREWYFTTSDSLVLLDQVVTDVINTLEQNRELSFCLDGQISILEDYLTIRKDKYSQLKALVSNKQLIIGPWYTQTDTFYVNGESIVNNLYYGIYESKRLFGYYMNIAYLPDTFGFSDDLPMIAAGFQIDSAIIWRGVDFEKSQIEPYFIWKSATGDEVKAAVLHGGYGAFKKANSTPIFMEKQLKPLLQDIENRTTQSQLLMPVGNDQLNITDDILETIKVYGDNFKVSSYEQFFQQFDRQIAPVFQGEFRFPRYARVHRSSGGIRVDIKRSNYQAEQQLLRITQPLLVLAKNLSLDVSSGIVEKAWKKLFEGQAHDGIVGCVSDDVAKDILNRNKQAYELAKSQENLLKRRIAHHVGLADGEILLFNPTLSTNTYPQVIEVFSHDANIVIDDVYFSEVISSQFIKGHDNALIEKPEGNYYQKEQDYYLHRIIVNTTIPAMGYKILRYKKAPVLSDNLSQDNQIENEKFCFVIKDQKINLITDHQVYSDFIRIVDQGNAGDTYDFSPLTLDNKVIDFTLVDYKIQKRNYSQDMELIFKARLPKDLAARTLENYTEDCTAYVKIMLVPNRLPTISLRFDNQVDNHNLRIGFQLGKKAEKSIASTNFGYISRDILTHKNLSNWQENNLEMPIDIHPNSGIVGIDDVEQRLWIFNRGVKEYQIIDSYAYMTCFSSTDELGKADLLYRPGRASGDITKKGHIRILTPMAQVHGEHHYEFAIGEFTTFNDAKIAFEKFEQPSCFYQSQKINLFYERIDNKIDLIEPSKAWHDQHTDYPAFDHNCLTSLYLSLYDQEPIIRFYSLIDQTLPQTISDHYQVGDLLEQPLNITHIQAYKLYTARRKKNEV